MGGGLRSVSALVALGVRSTKGLRWMGFESHVQTPGKISAERLLVGGTAAERILG